MILVAEDNEPMRELLKVLLLNEGYQVISARDGIEAVQQYKTYRANIQVVITDLEMPKLDGVGAYRQIKSIDPGVKVIFVSGAPDTQTRNQLHREGVQHFFPKPYMPAELLATIRKLLSAPVKSA